MDRADHLGGHERIASEHPRQARAAERAALEIERRFELARIVAQHAHVHVQTPPGLFEPPEVLPFERQERGDVELLVKSPFPRASCPAPGEIDRQHMHVALVPRRVGDLGHDRIDGVPARGEAVVETDGIERVARVPQMSEQAHRTQRLSPGMPRHALSDGLVERQRGRPQIVAAPKFRDVAAIHRPEPAIGEQAVELIEIDVELGNAVAKRVRSRRVAAVPDHALVDGAGELRLALAHSAASATGRLQREPSASATSRALRKPSSWNPQPQ